MITLLICHPQRLIREIWTGFFATRGGIAVVAATDNYSEAITLTGSLKPKIAIIAADLIRLSDLKQFNNLTNAHIHTQLIFVCTHYPVALSKYLRRIGTRAYLSKDSSINEMHTAILEVNAGFSYISESFSQEAAQNPDDFADNITLLTTREWEVLNLIAEGKTSKEIATVLGSSYKTVEVHRYHLLQKLGCKKTIHLLKKLDTAINH